MSKKDKLLARFLQIPQDFTWAELVTLLNGFGYSEYLPGKTGGSRRRFVHKNKVHIITLHKPHPDNRVKEYALKQVIEVLKLEGLL